MPITINGSGTLTGLSTGGLPDGSVNNADLAANAVSTSKILNGAVTLAKLGTDEQSGLCKAWVNFDGTAVTNPGSMTGVRASFNVSSITDNGTGDYTVTFTTALADANYVCVVSASSTVETVNVNPTGGVNRTASDIRIDVETNVPSQYDAAQIDVAIFR